MVVVVQLREMTSTIRRPLSIQRRLQIVQQLLERIDHEQHRVKSRSAIHRIVA
jgi:uncharacterized tellurite resistance protein B-like protein